MDWTLALTSANLPLGRKVKSTFTDAQIGWPSIICIIPAAIDVKKATLMLEICAVNCKLVVCVQLRFYAEIGTPRILSIAFKHKHTMVDSWAIEWAIHIYLRRWRIVVRVCCKDDIPFIANVM